LRWIEPLQSSACVNCRWITGVAIAETLAVQSYRRVKRRESLDRQGRRGRSERQLHSQISLDYCGEVSVGIRTLTSLRRGTEWGACASFRNEERLPLSVSFLLNHETRPPLVCGWMWILVEIGSERSNNPNSLTRQSGTNLGKELPKTAIFPKFCV
jgi:hypothetical protein